MAVEDFSFKEFMQACLGKWKWFAVSLICFVGLAYLYVACKEPVYERTEQILVKDQEAGGGIGNVPGAFASLGLFANNTSVNNELITITSPAITYEVVKRLHLDMDYVKKGGLHGVTLYGGSLPVIVNLPDVGEQEGAELRLHLEPDMSARLSKFVSTTANGKRKLKGELELKATGDTADSPLGRIILSRNPDYKGAPLSESMDIAVTKLPTQMAVELYGKKVDGDLVDEYADVIELVVKDVNVERGVDILNEIVNVYNQRYIDDKNKIAIATSAFIDERLEAIRGELGEVDNTIAGYQSADGSLNLYEEAKLMMEKNEEYSRASINLSNNLEMAKSLRDFISAPDNGLRILPMNTGIDSPELEKQIGTYNELLIARNKLAENSSASNPIVKDHDSQLDGMRKAILKGVENQLDRYQAMLSSARAEQSKAQGKIKETPGKLLPLMSEQRQQKVKENLYLFLLEKREENELTRKFTADNIRILTPPMGSLKPVSPKKKLILFISFILGAGVPLIWIYLTETNNTKVRSRKDLEKVGIPFAGEVPLAGNGKKGFRWPSRGRKKEEKPPAEVVEEGKRDVVNEAFRIIRSNIDFMSGKRSGGEAIMLTSFNPGSGKSFISYNLGLSFALKRKKVLLVDCDLRHGSTSMIAGSPGKGLTDFLRDPDIDWRKLAIKSRNPYLSVLPVGKIPPNPAELLENGKIGALIDEARKEYDYVLLDCPPVGIVADTRIVGQFADRTLFVVRALLLEKSALAELDEFHRQNILNRMSVILNGTEAVHSRYYTYGTYQHFND